MLYICYQRRGSVSDPRCFWIQAGMSAPGGPAPARTHVDHTGSKHLILRVIHASVGIPSVMFRRKDACRPWIRKHPDPRPNPTWPLAGRVLSSSTRQPRLRTTGGSSTGHGRRMDLITRTRGMHTIPLPQPTPGPLRPSGKDEVGGWGWGGGGGGAGRTPPAI